MQRVLQENLDVWLLDEGLPISLHKCLESLGVNVETVEFRKWKGLRNGKLVKVAAESNFSCILTKDKLFAQDAKKALMAHPKMAIVLIQLPQLPKDKYLKNFEVHWKNNKIKPVVGQVVVWPESV